MVGSNIHQNGPKRNLIGHEVASGNPVNALGTLRLVGDNGQAKFLLECTGKGAAHRVLLPACGRAYLRDSRAFGSFQHCDHFRLLAVCPGSRFCWLDDLIDRLGAGVLRQASAIDQETAGCSSRVGCSARLRCQVAQGAHLVPEPASAVCGVPAPRQNGCRLGRRPHRAAPWKPGFVLERAQLAGTVQALPRCQDGSRGRRLWQFERPVGVISLRLDGAGPRACPNFYACKMKQGGPRSKYSWQDANHYRRRARASRTPQGG